MLRRNEAIRNHFRTDCMTLILPSCACTPQVYLPLCNLLLFFPQDGLCLRGASELYSRGDSCCAARAAGRDTILGSGAALRAAPQLPKSLLKEVKNPPLKHNPDCVSNENFRVKPVHGFSEYLTW